jgi:adenosylcobinamide kinase/adenosylcobinamide-phosphate guanylyltransferase
LITNLTIAKSELILGGQKSGKSRRAELIARHWLTHGTDHRAVIIATAQPWDAEMRQRIERHQADRAERVPGMITVEEPLALAQTIDKYSSPETLLVVDCLTLWLTNCLMPIDAAPESAQVLPLLLAITKSTGPVVMVGNEIGMGVIPMGSEVRAFVDALGKLNQDVASTCQRVTLMVAGLPLTLKDV